jgi:hypothetical protein
MDYVNFGPEKFDDFILHLNKLEYKKDLSSFDKWGKAQRGIINLLINHFNYPYLTIRINELNVFVKESWNEFEEDSPFDIILELASFLKGDYKPKKYHHKILKIYQNMILETVGWKEYSYFIPEDESSFKLKNDTNVLQINLPSKEKDVGAYIDWLIYRLNQANIYVKYTKNDSLLRRWEKVNKLVSNIENLKRIDKFKKAAVPAIVLTGILIMSYVLKR